MLLFQTSILPVGQPLERARSKNDSRVLICFKQAADGAVRERRQNGIGKAPFEEDSLNRPGHPLIVTEKDCSVLPLDALGAGEEDAALQTVGRIGKAKYRRHAARILQLRDIVDA